MLQRLRYCDTLTGELQDIPGHPSYQFPQVPPSQILRDPRWQHPNLTRLGRCHLGSHKTLRDLDTTTILDLMITNQNGSPSKMVVVGRRGCRAIMTQVSLGTTTLNVQYLYLYLSLDTEVEKSYFFKKEMFL